MQVLYSVFEFVVGFDHYAQHVFEERKVVVAVLVPVLGAGLKGLVVRILALLDKHLDTDVLANDKAGTIQQKERQKTAHTAVPIVERVDAEEVQDEHRHQEKRVVGTGLDGIIESGAKIQHGIGLRPPEHVGQGPTKLPFLFPYVTDNDYICAV